MLKITWNTNQIIAVILGFASIIYIYLAFQIKPFAASVVMDSDVFPKILGFFLLLLSILLFFDRTDSHTEEVKEFEEEEEQEQETVQEQRWFFQPRVQVMVTLLGTLLYIFLFNRLGFVLSTFLFMTLIPRYYGYRKVLPIIVIASALSVGIYLGITHGLGVRLPQGILTFF